MVTWTRPDPLADVGLTVIASSEEPGPDTIDHNSGDDALSVFSSLVSDFAAAGALPEQGDSFTNESGDSFRIERVERTPAHPIIHFHCANALASD